MTKSVVYAIGLSLLAGSAMAMPVDLTVYQLKDQGQEVIDAAGLWRTAGTIGTLGDNAYKDGWIDSAANWNLVTSVSVSMLTDGLVNAFITFSPGSSKNDFFSYDNVTGSNWTDLDPTSRFFSIDGHAAEGRNWFVHHQYGGCSNDTGWMAVIRPSLTCNWEKTRIGDGNSNLLLLYAAADVRQNYSNGLLGVADTFRVTVTYDNGLSAVPLPAGGLLLGGAIAGMGLLRRRDRMKTE